jgi:hypothetical protein
MAKLHTKQPSPAPANDKIPDCLLVVDVVLDVVMRDRLVSLAFAPREFRREVPLGMAGTWALARCPLRVFEVPGVIDPERVQAYAALHTPAPPVVAYRSQGAQHLTVFDGCHRVTAARLRGDATLLAYVPAWQLRR